MRWQRRIVPGRKGTGGACLSWEVSPSQEPPFHISSLGAKRNQLTLQLEPINPCKSTTPSAVAVSNKRQEWKKSRNQNRKHHRLGSVRWALVFQSQHKCLGVQKPAQNRDFSGPVVDSAAISAWDGIDPVELQANQSRAGDPLEEAP